MHASYSMILSLSYCFWNGHQWFYCHSFNNAKSCFANSEEAFRGCATINWKREAEKWVKYAPKLSHTTPPIKQKLTSTPSHNDNINANPP